MAPRIQRTAQNGRRRLVEDIRDHYDRLASFYRAFWGEDIHHGYWEAEESADEAQLNLIKRLADAAEIARGDRVLDVGCGTGGSSVWLAGQRGCEVTGITISEVQIELARKRAEEAGVSDRVAFQKMDANDLDMPPNSFDAVWVIECSEHLLEKSRFIRQASRVLRPGGKFALCVWLRVDDLTAWEEREFILPVCEGFLCPSLASMSEYRQWLEENGMRQIRTWDITAQVERTWQLCGAIATRPEVQFLLRFADRRVRSFVNAFAAIRRAYAERKMVYGMIVARK